MPDTKINPKGIGVVDMANIFNSLVQYATPWSVKETRDFTKEEIEAVAEAVVVPSQYGNSVCFTMVRGGQTYIPLSNNSSKGVGEYINLAEAKLLTLEKAGENDIFRIEI